MEDNRGALHDSCSYLQLCYFWWCCFCVLVSAIRLRFHPFLDAHKGYSLLPLSTVLTYCGLFSYFAACAIHGYSFSRALRKWKAAQTSAFRGTLPTRRMEKSTPHDLSTLPRSRLERSAVPLQFLFSWLVSTVYTFPIIVTAVFWAVLSKGALNNPASAYSNVSVHALNLGFSYLDLIFLGRAPMRPWLHLPLTLCLIAAYLGVAYIYAGNSGIYVYSFLDPNAVGGTGAVAGICIGIGAATVVAFLLGQFLIWAREAVAAMLQGYGARKWGAAKPMRVDDAALFPVTTGPGPHGEGSSRRAV